MSRQTQADLKEALISANFDSDLTLPKTPWPTDHSVYYQRHQSRQSHVRAPEKTDHHDDNMQITHIGIMMITLTRNPMTRINLWCKHTEIHFIYAKFVPLTLMSHYPEILSNTSWQNCALSKTLKNSNHAIIQSTAPWPCLPVQAAQSLRAELQIYQPPRPCLTQIQ